MEIPDQLVTVVSTYLHKKPYEEVVAMCLELDAYVARNKKKTNESDIIKNQNKGPVQVFDEKKEDKGSTK